MSIDRAHEKQVETTASNEDQLRAESPERERSEAQKVIDAFASLLSGDGLGGTRSA